MSSPTTCFLGRFCHGEHNSPCCRWPHSQCPSCLFRTVCRQHGVWVDSSTSCQGPWHPTPALAALGGAEHTSEWGQGGSSCRTRLVLCKFVSALLCPSFCLLPVLLPLGHFFPSPLAIFTACFPSCICKAASNKALADNLISKHNQSCSFH